MSRRLDNTTMAPVTSGLAAFVPESPWGTGDHRSSPCEQPLSVTVRSRTVSSVRSGADPVTDAPRMAA
ncbi:hypothetical protein [Nesterenkonia suensis]